MKIILKNKMKISKDIKIKFLSFSKFINLKLFKNNLIISILLFYFYYLNDSSTELFFKPIFSIFFSDFLEITNS